MRTQSTDAAVQIEPKIDFSLEESMEFIQIDEYLEITPESLRMRKIGYGENKRFIPIHKENIKM
jgi:GTP-binding protein